MKNNSYVIDMNRDGELVQKDLHDFTKDKYKPDNMFMWGPIPYILMIVCVIIDISFFRSLFMKISYDDPIMIWLEVAGLAFGADVVAVYAGILAKQIKQGLSNERLNLYLLLAVPIFALLVNAILRFATMSLVSFDGTVDAATIALTIIAIVTPMFTSVGNFCISYQTYNPLEKRMLYEEVTLDELQDLCRRLEAIKKECDDFSGEKIMEMDRNHLENTKRELINEGLMRANNIDINMMEYLQNPTATNELSKSNFHEFISRIQQELEGLKSVSVSENSEENLEEHAEENMDRKNVIDFAETA